MFYIDKYAPLHVDNSFFHKEILNQLKLMSKDTMIPNIIFYGPPGSGKNTIIRLFLQMIYDSDINKISEVSYNVTGSGNIISEIKIKQSNYHIIIDPNTNNNFDRYIVQDVVKEYAKRVPFNIFKTNMLFRTILINNTHKLSYYAQTSLRRTMEKFSTNCRFILCSSSLSKVLDPLRSRCLVININRPSIDELFEYILDISFKENIKLSLTNMKNILVLSNCNIKKALWLLESLKYNLNLYNSYNDCITCIVNKLKSKQTIIDLDQLIKYLYKIITTNINGSQIIKDIMIEICKIPNISEISKYHIIITAAKCESRLIKGRREIIHLQSFLCNIIRILKSNK